MTAPARRLGELERVIDRGLRTFVEVGNALREIRDERLYHGSHTTFEDYCRERWGFSRQRAHQHIEAAEVAGVLSTTVDKPAPETERQARELAPLKRDTERLEKAWAEATKDGEPTAEKVREAVAKQRQPEATRPQPARHLHVVDTATGEVQEPCEACAPMVAELRVQLEGAQSEGRMWRARYAKLKAEAEDACTDDPLYGDVRTLFDYWRAACNHPASRFDAARFRIASPYLRRYGMNTCRKAIDGAAFDPYTTKRRNGTTKRHDGWELIFRDASKFEDFANRAP
ncbi:MAG: hypothetical protein U0R52_06150 [Solirubrobacterales bacterium]